GRQRRVRRGEDGVAIRLRLGDVVGRERAAAPGPVHEGDGHAQGRGERGLDDAGRGVGGGAGGEGGGGLGRARGICRLRAGVDGERAERDGDERCREQSLRHHVSLSRADIAITGDGPGRAAYHTGPQTTGAPTSERAAVSGSRIVSAMTAIAEVRADHYVIKLPVTLSDSTHGQIDHFELVAVRVRDGRGAEGLGYTYTVGATGAAVHATINRDLAPRLVGERADLIEAMWKKMWWALHYGGRGGTAAMAISAVDIALWDLKARTLGVPLWTLLGGHDAGVPCYAGGIDLDFPLDKLLAQTDANLN